MPCYDGREGHDEIRYDSLNRKYEAVKTHLDERTNQLCRTLELVKKTNEKIYAALPADIRQWHTEHEAWDKLRKKK